MKEPLNAGYQHEQPLVPKINEHNAYSISRQAVNSKEYHDKFSKLPVNHEVQEALYKEAGRLLRFVDGQEEERMIAVNARTGELIVDNINRDGSINGTGFTYDEYKKIEKCNDNIIVMHNHSLNGRPSAQDLLTYLHNDNMQLSLIICHDGSIYAIYGVRKKFEKIYLTYLEEAKHGATNIKEAKRLTTTALYRLNEKYNIFDVRRL